MFSKHYFKFAKTRGAYIIISWPLPAALDFFSLD